MYLLLQVLREWARLDKELVALVRIPRFLCLITTATISLLFVIYRNNLIKKNILYYFKANFEINEKSEGINNNLRKLFYTISL